MAVVVPALDVPVTTQLKFQQSLLYVFVKVPQIQLCTETGTHSARCEEIVEFHRAVLGMVVDAPGLVVQTVQKTELVPQLQFIDVGSRSSESGFRPFLRAFFRLRPFGRRVRTFW